MRRLVAASFVGLLLAASVAACTTPADPEDEQVYIVVLEETVEPELAVREHEDLADVDVGHVYEHALRGYAARMTDGAADRIARDPRVASVQPDRPVRAVAQTLPTGVDRAEADRSPTARIDGVDDRVDVDVAVIDTGIDLDHPDLNVHTDGARNCSPGRDADDGNGHGTHVAGTVGALDNTAGVVGMAPGARVWPVRVLDDRGSGSWSTVICGIDHVTANADAIEVANMSLGGPGSDDGDCGDTDNDAMHQAICAAVAAGVTFVVAAGNDHVDANRFVPAAYDEVITVSALADFNGRPGGGAPTTCRSDTDDTFADFSNYGADVDVIAPGVCINSTWKDGGYNTISGTSMASPHAAGAAALYVATHPGVAPAAVKAALQAAGTTDWTWPSEDLDSIQEKLLDASTF